MPSSISQPRIFKCPAWVWATAVCLLSAATVQGGTSEIELPDIGGDSSQSVFSSTQEKEIGERFMRELRANVTVIDDPEVVEYIESLGYRLASNSGEETISFTFFVVESSLINAFAAPGGYIGINSGLITATQSESELAAVFAHEIAHVTQRHIARSVELQNRSSLPVMAGLIAAILIGTQNPQAGAGVAAAVQGGAVQALLDFTRANEQEADRVGIQTLAAAGLDPRAMPVFFERLQEASRYYGTPPEFLSTHPVTTSRIAESQARAEQYPYRQYQDSVAYHLVRAKLKVREYDIAADAVVYFRETLEQGKAISELGASYGYALALVEDRQYAEARKVVEKLIEMEPERISFYRLLAELEKRSGNIEEALFIYEDNLELYPQDRSLIVGYAEALVEIGRPGATLKALDRYARSKPLDAHMYKIAALAHERLDNRRGSHAALSEHYYLLGNLSQAVHQLELALRAPGNDDYYVNARIQARLEQLKQELDERTRDQ